MSFLCDSFVNFDPPKNGLEDDTSKVQTNGKVSFAPTIEKCCELRNDEWAFNVRGKIEFFYQIFMPRM